MYSELKQKPLDCHVNFLKCTLTVEYIVVLWVATLIFDENKLAGRTAISAKCMTSSWLFMHRRPMIFKLYEVCNATSNLDKYNYIRCLRAESQAKYAKKPIITQNMLKYGTWFWLMTVAWYIALQLTPRYHCLDPTNRDMSRVHCIWNRVITGVPAVFCWS